MTTVAIMQPTYLGWAGYFSLIDQADIFILDDQAQYVAKSWHSRNRIRTGGGNIVWLTVPVHGHRAPLNTIEIANEREWISKHWATIEQAYRKTPGWEHLSGYIRTPFDRDWQYLTDFTTDVIGRLARCLGISTYVVHASTLGPTRPGMADRISDLCHHVDATTLLNTRTAEQYLDESMLDHIRIQWHDYHHPTYGQAGQEWQSHLSVLDLLAHCGKDSLNVIRGNPIGNLHSNP